MFLKIRHNIYVTQKAEITRDDLVDAKVRGHLVLDIGRMTQFNPEENKWEQIKSE